MKNLKLTALGHIWDKYKVKETDVEIIDLVNEILISFDDEKLTYRSIKFFYNKEGKPTYNIEKEIKLDDEVDILGDGNKPKEPQAPTKKPPFEWDSPPKEPQAPKEPKKYIGNEQVKNLIEGLEMDIEGLRFENEELKKGDKALVSKLDTEKRALQGENEDLKKEIKNLNKEIDKLKSQIKLNADASTDLADYVKMKQNQYKKTVTPEQIELIKKLIQEGKTEKEIVKLSNTSNGTVHRVKNGVI